MWGNNGNSDGPRNRNDTAPPSPSRERNDGRNQERRREEGQGGGGAALSPFHVDPNSFGVDGVARRARMSRASMRASAPALRAPPPKLLPAVDGRAGDALFRRLVDMRGMQRTVAAWPVDEVEGLLIYCERLREEKIAAERQLAELHTNRALAAARGMVATTSLQHGSVDVALEQSLMHSAWGGPLLDGSERSFSHSAAAARGEIRSASAHNHTPQRDLSRRGPPPHQMPPPPSARNPFQSGGKTYSAEDAAFLSRHYQDL